VKTNAFENVNEAVQRHPLRSGLHRHLRHAGARDRRADHERYRLCAAAPGHHRRHGPRATSQLPLDNVELRLFNAQGYTVGFGQTGPDGRYRVEVHPGTYFLRAETRRHLDEVFDERPLPAGLRPGHRHSILVGPASHVTGIDFGLRLGGASRARSPTPAAARPLAFARLAIFDSTGDFVEPAFTGATGRCRPSTFRPVPTSP
jgi:hypothetical protein